MDNDYGYSQAKYSLWLRLENENWGLEDVDIRINRRYFDR